MDAIRPGWRVVFNAPNTLTINHASSCFDFSEPNNLTINQDPSKGWRLLIHPLTTRAAKKHTTLIQVESIPKSVGTVIKGLKGAECTLT